MGANRTPVLGHIDCPVCGFAEMQIKHDKNGQASGYCPDCSQQIFTRNDHKSGLLLKRMRAAAPGVAPAAPAAAPAVAPIAATPAPGKAAPARQAGAQGAKPKPDKETPAPAVKAAPRAANPAEDAKSAPKVAGWLRPLIGSQARKGGEHAA